MISIADLLELDRHPQAAYPGYEKLRDAARRRSGGFTDPADLPRYAEVHQRRGMDWCRRVTGRPILNGPRSISCVESDMLLIADEAGFDPPAPAWLTEWTAESERMQQAIADQQAAARQADAERWAAALVTCGVQVEVRPNLNGRRYGAGLQGDGALRHVVPLQDAVSTVRLHPAGRPLCDASRTRGRHGPRQLGEPVSGPATCKSCLRYTAEVKPAQVP